MAVIPRDDNGAPLTTVAVQGYVVAYSGNAANTTGGSDYIFKWGITGSTAIHHLMLQNNTAANAQWEMGIVTSNGSPVLAPGQTLFLDAVESELHLLTAANQNVNGSSGSNIVVRAWL